MAHTENVKKADRLRYWLTYLLKDLDVGTTFKPDALHLTFIPWFISEEPHEEIIKSFYDYFSNQKAFTVMVGQTHEFKNKRKIPINLVKPSAELLALHGKTLDWFGQLEGRWAVKNPHVGDDYIPHIRRRQGHNVNEGDRLNISSLSLVTAARRGDEVRTVAARVRFG
jgi:2'-5' RNA ligase